MTPDDLTAIRERANQATPGPWINGHNTAERHSGVTSNGDGYEGARIAEVPSSAPDAVFIAHAREDIPALLDYVDTLTARLAAVRELHRYYTDQSGKKWCDHCAVHVGYEQFDSRPWPCPTIKALEGDQ